MPDVEIYCLDQDNRLSLRAMTDSDWKRFRKEHHDDAAKAIAASPHIKIATALIETLIKTEEEKRACELGPQVRVGFPPNSTFGMLPEETQRKLIGER